MKLRMNYELIVRLRRVGRLKAFYNPAGGNAIQGNAMGQGRYGAIQEYCVGFVVQCKARACCK